MTMTALRPQTALVGFALITLLLAAAAVGRVFGVSFGEALYLTGLVLVVLGWITSQLMRRCATSSEDQEA